MDKDARLRRSIKVNLHNEFISTYGKSKKW